MKKSSKVALVLLAGFLLIFPTITRAQTIYKKDPGFFVLGLQSYHNNLTYLSFGPAIGYRFGKHFDVRLHPQFLFVNKLQTGIRNNQKHFSALNLGLIGGYTTSLSDRWQLRAQLALYKIFQLDADQYLKNNNKPNPNSGVASFSVYYKIPLAKTVAFYPNAGVVLGYGVDTRSYMYKTKYGPFRLDAPHLTDHVHGVVSGVRLGFDMLFKFSPNFYLTISPDFRFLQETESADDLIIDSGVNIEFNF